jgi:hypothetical protein
VKSIEEKKGVKEEEKRDMKGFVMLSPSVWCLVKIEADVIIILLYFSISLCVYIFIHFWPYRQGSRTKA